MHDREWVEYFTKRLAEAERALAGFENAVAQHGLRVFERDQQNGERDVTERHRRMLRDEVEDYRKRLSDD